MIEFLFKDGLLGFITMVVIKPGWYAGGGGMSWSLNFEVWH